MSRALVIGVDPGQTTGIVGLACNDRGSSGPGLPVAPMVVQCDPGSVVPIVCVLLDRHLDYVPHIAVEEFVVGPRAARSRTPQAGRIARRLINDLASLGRAPVVLRPAGLVKPWATERRMAAAGLIAPTNGMGHARDAARHALYEAVHAGIIADPMRATLGAV